MDGALIGYQTNVGSGWIVKLLEQEGLKQDVRGQNSTLEVPFQC